MALKLARRVARGIAMSKDMLDSKDIIMSCLK